MDLLRHLVLPALVITAIVLVDVGRRWRVRRAVESSPDGHGHTVSVRIHGSVPPWPTRQRWGRVARLDDGTVVFVPTFRGDPIALGGLTLRSQKLVESRRIEMLLRFTDDVGADVYITVDDASAPLLEAILAGDDRGDAAPSTQSPRLRTWTPGIIAGVVLSAMSIVVAWWAIVASVPVSATVVGRTTSACTVEWQDPGTGRTEQDTADCDGDARNGGVLDVHATAWPLVGHAMTDSFRYGAFGGLALIVCGSTLFAVARRRRAAERVARIAPAPRRAERRPVVVEAAEVRPLSSSELSWDAITEQVLTRAEAERWTTMGDPRDVPPIPSFTRRFPWWTVRPVWRSLLVPFAGMLTAALLLVATVLYAAPWAARTAALRGDTVIRSASVSDEPADQLLPFLPSEFTVDVDTGSGTQQARVTWVGPPPAPGTTITVETAVDDASQARSVDHDGLVAMSLLAAGATLVLSAMLGVGIVRRRRQVVTTAEALRAGATPVRYVLLIDPGEVVFVLLSPADGPQQVVPSFAMVAIGHPLGVLPPAGSALAHGVLRAGERVVVETPRGAIWPFSPLLTVDDEADVLDMVNAWHAEDDPTADDRAEEA